MEITNSLFKEANDKLIMALHENDLKGASVAHAILDIAHLKLDSATKALETVRENQQAREKHKLSMMDTIVTTAKKKNSLWLMC